MYRRCVIMQHCTLSKLPSMNSYPSKKKKGEAVTLSKRTFSYTWAFSVCSSLQCFQMICSFLLRLPKRFPLCTTLISRVVNVSKGNEWTFMQGLWRYTRSYTHQPCILSEWNPLSFIWCFLVYKKCSFEHIKRKCEHLLGQPHSLAAFFYPANDCIFFLSAACWRHFCTSC